MGKPTTNTDGKNAQHQAKVLQTKGFSKQGSKDIVEGKAPEDPVDRVRTQGPAGAKAPSQTGGSKAQSDIKSKYDQMLDGIASKLKG